MARHFHVVMSQSGFVNDYFSDAYATEEEAQDALRSYVDTDLEDGAVEWEWESDTRCVEADGEATVEIQSCDLQCDQYWG